MKQAGGNEERWKLYCTFCKQKMPNKEHPKTNELHVTWWNTHGQTTSTERNIQIRTNITLHYITKHAVSACSVGGLVTDRRTPREEIVPAPFCLSVPPSLGLPDAIIHTDTATFQITLQGGADVESLKFLISGSFFYVCLLAFCWAGDNLTEQVIFILTEPIYRHRLILRFW